MMSNTRSKKFSISDLAESELTSNIFLYGKLQAFSYEIIKSNFRRGKIVRTTEYLIKWKGVNENGDAWDNTWEPAEFINAPELLAKYLAKRKSSDVPYYDVEDGMWKNLPCDTVSKDVLEELAGYTKGALSSSDEDEV